MPRNAGPKRRNRKRQAQDDVRYLEARRREAAAAAPAAGPLVEESATPDIAPRSVEDLLRPYIEDWCADQLGVPVEDLSHDWTDNATPWTTPLQNASVHELTPELYSIDTHTVDEYEGGQVALSIFVEAALRVDGILPKSDAYTAVDAGQATLLTGDWNDHDAEVLDAETLALELEFNALVTPETESVEDFQIDFVRHLGPS